MTSVRGRLLLLPTPLGATAPEQVLPAPVLAAARGTRHFLAERAKSARAFLRAIAHPVPLRELAIAEVGHHPDAARIDGWLQPALGGADVAILAEAGCPAVADPGASIVARAHALGIPVKPLVGPSAILLALMASGFDGQHFRFVGYLPQDARALARAIAALEARARAGETQLWIETPYRNQKLFGALLAHCAADTELCIAIALTTAEEFIAARRIAQWRCMPAPAVLARAPAVFALAAPPLSRPRAR
ncbi:MAG: SAM-dependent methyltransferase [Burkholderiaceae bacterium]|nr:SAM-dependent methyltransferase [Burkholderiaceae bacterium]